MSLLGGGGPIDRNRSESQTAEQSWAFRLCALGRGGDPERQVDQGGIQDAGEPVRIAEPDTTLRSQRLQGFSDRQERPVCIDGTPALACVVFDTASRRGPPHSFRRQRTPRMADRFVVPFRGPE